MSGYRYLTLADRQTLEALYLEGDRVQDIADQIGVHVATVYKELKRGETGGLDRNMRREYSATLAQRRLAENFKRRGRKTDEAEHSDLAEAVKVYRLRKESADMKKDFRYDATLLSRASFPAVLEAGNRPCIVETTVYRLNAVAVTSLMLDGFEPLLNFIGLSPDDTYITQHEVEDIVTVVHIRKEAEAWQHSTK